MAVSGHLEDDIRRACQYSFQPGADAIVRLLGRPLDGCEALEIGPGQWLAQARFFSRWAKVIAIDLDVLPSGLDLGAYWQMWRTNGWRRVAKTLGRKALGFDRRGVAAHDRVITGQKHRPIVRQMDATSMSFANDSFDFAYSFNVMEHVPDPEAVFRECARVVKSGGVVYHDLHLYTSDSGGHDTRSVTGVREGLPYWAHLRPAAVDQVRYGGYVNKLSYAAWMAIIDRAFPGAELSFNRDDRYREELATLRAAGELRDFADDELLIRNIRVAWRKP